MVKFLLLLCLWSVVQVKQSSCTSLGSNRINREMTPQGFYGDTFSDGFGRFRTMKKRKNKEDLKVTIRKKTSKITFEIRQ